MKAGVRDISLRWIVLVSLPVLVSVAGCRKEHPERMPDGRIPVHVYLLLISAGQVDYYRWAETTFENRNPDVDVIIEQFPGSSLKDFEIKLRLRFASRQAPDLFHVNQVLAYDLHRKDLLDEAPGFIQEMVDSNSANEFVRQAPYVDGKLYGITADAVWTALYYNKDHFRDAGLDPETPPATWNDLLEYARRLTQRREDGTPTRAGFALRKTGFKPGTGDKWLTFLFSQGGQAFNGEGTETRFFSDAGRRALGLYRTFLFDERLDSVSLEGDELDFAQGRSSMFLRESYVIRMLRNDYPNVDFGVGPVPKGVTSTTPGSVYLFAVSNHSSDPKKDAAWKFTQFLMQDEGYERYVKIGGIMPATASIANREEYRNDPMMNVFLNQEVFPQTPFPDYARAMELLGAHIERFCYGKQNTEETLKRAAEQIDALLARNKN